MWPHRVVVEPPLFDEQSGFFKASEPFLIEAFLPKAAIEALYVAVLRRLAWIDEVQLHPFLLGPYIQFLAPELRSIVDLKQFGPTELLSDLLQHTNYALATQTGVDLNAQAAPGEDVDQV